MLEIFICVFALYGVFHALRELYLIVCKLFDVPEDDDREGRA